jgi:hypothetical protein
MKMAVFWGVSPRSLVEVYRRFRGAYCLHHQACSSASIISIMMGSAIKGEKFLSQQLLVGKYEGTRPAGRWRRREDNIKMDL